MYVVDCDASGVAAAAVLQQWQDGKLKVIEYASRTFTRAERSYGSTRREMTALIFGLKQFRPYLLGRHFQIRVDNQALTYYQRMKDASGQAARYLDFLADYDFETIYRAGSRHVNADSIGRMRTCDINDGDPCDQCNVRVTGKHHVGAIQTRSQRKHATKQYGNDVPDMAVNSESPSGQRCDNLDMAVNFELPPHWRPDTPDVAVTGSPPHAMAQQCPAKRHDTSKPINLHDSTTLQHAQAAAQRRGTAKQAVSCDSPAGSAKQTMGGGKFRRRRRRRCAVPSLLATAPLACDAGVGDWSTDSIRMMQQADKDIAPAIAWLESGDGLRPPWADVQASVYPRRCYYRLADDSECQYTAPSRSAYARHLINYHGLRLRSRRMPYGPSVEYVTQLLLLLLVCVSFTIIGQP